MHAAHSRPIQTSRLRQEVLRRRRGAAPPAHVIAVTRAPPLSLYLCPYAYGGDGAGGDGSTTSRSEICSDSGPNVTTRMAFGGGGGGSRGLLCRGRGGLVPGVHG
ncbi:hypothetical protein PVAP13_1NG133838 [Panicum virgatum]|uniref:Uncharacterized protein n=1 Tax=Panicum virgatum TaxID=38727 RepID=A0A8T0WY56_PANVG|nr:hypothetical protein PVAP13_1NG133838 [Panicum virgatum]